MSTHLAQVFDAFNHIMVVCPCCGDVVRLSDTHPYLAGKKPTTPFDSAERTLAALDGQEERLEEKLQAMRVQARESGLRKAKKQLRRIDPVFCGSGLDPQDVKVLFDPVEYVVFDGLAKERLKKIVFMAEAPENQVDSKVQTSIQKSIKRGNCDFITLRITADGSVERE